MGQLNSRQIEMHLRSAMDALTPDVLGRIDLSVPQTQLTEPEWQNQAVILQLQRRMRRFATAAAACVCLTLIGGGAFHYHMENRRVESVIGLDVNPSVELSINRRERVLEARALNDDAEEILDGMDLKGVELNVAVNAVVGSMVTHGYLDDLDNAILVTVSNDSVRKSRELRASVVGDIERTLQENQVEAVVYDQQVIEDEEMEELARRYGISYGKAYFLKELIEQNDSLSMEEMEELSSMTMEEIARKIADDSYELGESAGRATEASTEETAERQTEPETESATETPAAEPETEETPESVTEAATREPEPTTTQAESSTEEEPEDNLVEIDYVDYEDGMVYVYFLTRIDWIKPSVVVRDEEGNSYAAMIAETSRKECSIEVGGLEGGQGYTFVLGGLAPAGDDTTVTVRGYFEKPEIAEEIEDDTEEEETGDTETDRETTSLETETEEPSRSQEETLPATEPENVPEEGSEEQNENL